MEAETRARFRSTNETCNWIPVAVIYISSYFLRSTDLIL